MWDEFGVWQDLNLPTFFSLGPEVYQDFAENRYVTECYFPLGNDGYPEEFENGFCTMTAFEREEWLEMQNGCGYNELEEMEDLILNLLGM